MAVRIASGQVNAVCAFVNVYPTVTDGSGCSEEIQYIGEYYQKW